MSWYRPLWDNSTIQVISLTGYKYNQPQIYSLLSPLSGTNYTPDGLKFIPTWSTSGKPIIGT